MTRTDIRPAIRYFIDSARKVIPSCSIATRFAFPAPPYICCQRSVIRSITDWSLIGGASLGRSITPDSAVPFRNDLPAYCWMAWACPIAFACSMIGETPT